MPDAGIWFTRYRQCRVSVHMQRALRLTVKIKKVIKYLSLTHLLNPQCLDVRTGTSGVVLWVKGKSKGKVTS